MFEPKEEMRRIRSAAEYIRTKLGEAEIAIVLGSGLGNFAEKLSDAAYLPTAEIPYIPLSTAPGHAGKWWRGTLSGKTVYMLQGRTHYYEGYSAQEITRYVRVMALLGVKKLFLTNAGGCVNTAWNAGDLMLISDHINFSGTNPLIGPNLDEMGPRFQDMGDDYDPGLRAIAKEAAAELGTTLREGVYAWFSGPSYETPAEVRMAGICGADAVGMSTAPETIVARHCGIKVIAISCMTNMAAGLSDIPLDEDEVLRIAAAAEGRFQPLVARIIEKM